MAKKLTYREIAGPSGRNVFGLVAALLYDSISGTHRLLRRRRIRKEIAAQAAKRAARAARRAALGPGRRRPKQPRRSR